MNNPNIKISMKLTKLLFLPPLYIALIAGCTTQYYGYTKEEWNRMTPFEQEKAKVEWRDVIAAKEQGALGDPRKEINQGFVDYSKGTEEESKPKEK